MYIHLIWATLHNEYFNILLFGGSYFDLSFEFRSSNRVLLKLKIYFFLLWMLIWEVLFTANRCWTVPVSVM